MEKIKIATKETIKYILAEDGVRYYHKSIFDQYMHEITVSNNIDQGSEILKLNLDKIAMQTVRMIKKGK
jgi:hypothetical protein